MASSKRDLATWFDEAVAQGAKFMIVVCDTFDYEDYPIPCRDAADCLDQYEKHDGKNMQQVMEVYDLSKDKYTQLNAPRVWNLPKP